MHEHVINFKSVTMFVSSVKLMKIHYVTTEVFDDPLLLSASIDLELLKVSIMAVIKGPNFDTSLHWLQWHVLLQGGATCELYHGFINGKFLVWVIEV